MRNAEATTDAGTQERATKAFLTRNATGKTKKTYDDKIRLGLK